VRAVSDRFLSTLRGSHLAVFRARVCTTFQTGTNPVGTEITIEGGDVQSSTTAEIRSTLNLTTTESWPATATDLLAPYGHEIYVERGIRYGNGQSEWVGLGYFRIDTPEQDQAPDGPIALSCPDRMAGIVDGRFLAPRQFTATTTRAALVSTLITEVYPAAVIEWDDVPLSAQQIGRSVVGEDRAALLRDVLTSLGKVGYFDHRGLFVIKTPPAVTGAAAWTIDAGADGVMVQMSRALTREGVHNVVVATGEAADTSTPVRAVVADLNPASPTRYGGPFGPVPRFFSSPFITTTAQATSAATALLRQSLGLPYQVDLDSIPNPALEPYDVLEVKYPKRSRSPVLRTEVHAVDQVTIPLTPNAAVKLKTREQLVENFGAPT
jgi:hypothetical protein